jgi:NodT family efflux transporter outer membrane factor (OMF) lipoprotein
VTLAAPLCGCTTLREYIHNGFKVGPNYARPPAPVAQNWIDAQDPRVRTEADDLSHWWTVFNDPVLNDLVCTAYLQNLTLRQAGMRVLEARAQLGIAVGNFFPQTQQMTGDYNWHAISTEIANRSLNPQTGAPTGQLQRFYGQWDYGFSLAWELDFWGRFRRAIEGSTDSLDAAVENYDSALVTLLGDVATNYAQLRITEQRIRYAQQNVELQRQTLTLVKARFDAGMVSELDLDQAKSTLAQTEATIPELEIALRQFNNQLCILLGIPPEELRAKLGPAPILNAPPDVAAGIPADLLRRRPDVRAAERQAAAQSAQIGVAESNFYPHISINGTLGYSAESFKDLFKPTALSSTVGPSVQWNILNYGRILNNVRLQEATFGELVAAYQNTVLTAAQDVENGLVTFLKAQQRTKFQAESVAAADKAVKLALVQYKGGIIDFTRVTQLETTLVQLQDTLAVAQGEIGLGLIQVYRALGGGWEIRCTGCAPSGLYSPCAAGPAEEALPAPAPVPAKPTPKNERAPVSEAPGGQRARVTAVREGP